MDFNTTIDLIIRELEEAREIIDDLKKFQGAPVIQIELAKSKCRNASEVIALLKEHIPSANAVQVISSEIPPKPTPVTVPEPGSAAKAEKTAAPEPEKQKVTQKESKKEVDEIKAEEQAKEVKAKPVTVKDKPKEKETPRDKEPEPEPDVEHTTKEPEPQKPFVAPIIADTFSHLANRFNEQMGETRSDDFSFTHVSNLTNLADSIGVNDRFFYIREVFDGDREAYNKAIARLEQVENVTEAKVVLMNYRAGKPENEAVRQLLDLVKRKITGHE